MPRKGMRSITFHPETYAIARISNASSSGYSLPSTPLRLLSESVVDQAIEAAESVIMTWNPDTSTFAKVTSLFYENKREATWFLKCVNNLQKVMHSLSSEDPSSEKLKQAQNLMKIAMKRLQKEFYQILSMNRAHLDPETVSLSTSRASTRSSFSDFDDFTFASVTEDDDGHAAADIITEVEQVSTVAMTDLKSIADCMINAGYALECINVYRIIRKSIIDEGIYRLGVERFSSSQINRVNWDSLDLKIKNWLDAVKVSVRTLFHGERILCDHVFSASYAIRESCFTDISKEAATLLFGFPDIVAKSKVKSSEKLLRILDMYSVIAGNWPDIESIFSFESTSNILSQALNSLARLRESVRVMILDFESSIQKDSSKTLVPGGGVHPLTIRAMNYLTLLADYSNVLGDITFDWTPPEKSLLPDSYFDGIVADDTPAPIFTLHVAWLILVLLCKLDDKAKHYKEFSLSYLFLANNLQHVVSKLRMSNLQYLLGEEWIRKLEDKVKRFAAKYEQLAWGQVYKSLPVVPKAPLSPARAKSYFKNFNTNFELVYEKQSLCVVPDAKLRDEIKLSIARKLLLSYRDFYEMYRAVVGGEKNQSILVRFAPESVGKYLSDLFTGRTGSRSANTALVKTLSLSRSRNAAASFRTLSPRRQFPRSKLSVVVMFGLCGRIKTAKKYMGSMRK